MGKGTAGHAVERAVITTYTGRHIDLLNPDPAQIHFDDIAASLSRQRRFAGHTHRDYTVGEHLLLGLDFCAPAAGLAWLLHDATEAYLGDVMGPLKRSSRMQYYRDLEDEWAVAIVTRFGPPSDYLGGKFSVEIATIDGRMLATELRDLKGRRPESSDEFLPFRMRIPSLAMSSEQLQAELIGLFGHLCYVTPGAIR